MNCLFFFFFSSSGAAWQIRDPRNNYDSRSRETHNSVATMKIALTGNATSLNAMEPLGPPFILFFLPLEVQLKPVMSNVCVCVCSGGVSFHRIMNTYWDFNSALWCMVMISRKWKVPVEKWTNNGDTSSSFNQSVPQSTWLYPISSSDLPPCPCN